MVEVSNEQGEVKESKKIRIVVILLLFLALIIFSISIFPLHRSNDWEEITVNPWRPRGYHQTLVFQDKMWIMGGVTDTGISKKNRLFINHSLACDNCEDSTWTTGDLDLNDVWYSSDGTNWTQAVSSAPWSSRRNHTAVVYDEKIWILGGYGNKKNLNDVWYSSNGIDWTQATSSAQWSPRRGHTSVVYDNKMWVIGGAGANAWDDNLNDVWYSSNGIDWTQATSSAPWSKRSSHSSVVFNNQMWLVGGWSGWGKNNNDVWYSTDGINWKESSASWEPRWGHTSTVHDNKIWVMGGNIYGENNGEKRNTGDNNDVWYSTDGIDWKEFKEDIQWESRRGLRSLTFEDTLWIIGGVYGSKNKKVFTYGDIWKLSL